ncbi:hypothetical protein [Ottowia testudinis]|uniref:Uncharacterized protein n=1 Tax=Ottowia testudinis TaxID=2816950 RepID=A0A975CFH7_9BURK|nr:hypothetical protein [Ottowia testudinis]QTD45455.1 hypothetical protein J1M35_00565 [Ottowia testudinis]
MKAIAAPLALLALLAGSCALAQEVPAAFVGKWKAEWTNRNGRAVQAQLELPAAGKGSWQTHGQSRNNLCVGKQAPVYVESATPEQVVLAIKMSETVAGCDDSNLILSTTTGAAPSAKWRSGGEVTLSR